MYVTKNLKYLTLKTVIFNLKLDTVFVKSNSDSPLFLTEKYLNYKTVKLRLKCKNYELG